MHELSIAMSMVEMAEEEAAAAGRSNARVLAVHLKLGPLSGVVKEALLSCYEMACAATRLEGSQLLIEDVPVAVFCPNCKARRNIASIQRMSCPECGMPTPEVVQGKELEVVALEISE